MSEISGIRARLSHRLNFEWRTRHLLVLLAAGIGTYAFLESRAEWSEMHRWNRAIGDMSVLLIAFSMAAGPLSRLWTGFRRAVPWRREAGIYGVLLAVIHTIIILDGWVDWNLIRLFGYEFHPVFERYVMLQHGFGLANVIGIVALVYGAVLASTSNNLSQRLFGGSVWKFVQQSSYVLWMLIIIHTAYFLYLHFQDFHRAVPDPNWAQLPFAGLVVFVTLLQVAAFLKTWRAKRRSRRASASWGRKANAVAPPVIAETES
ncbi:MAG: ferric reductase-like transmembrane domain-containing protein [Proteobacteria bacterium]|nr:ferric reductase-like transmembrane domain-containing protein [Pseudomonadota bacterium]